MPSTTSNWPVLNPQEQQHLKDTLALLRQMIHAQGPLRFDHFMQTALYHPQLGYYMQPKDKLSGSDSITVTGDFATAPELSPWFGRSLANQVRQVLDQNSKKRILEFGAGSGKLAKSLLEALNDEKIEYFILELSGDLKARQATSLKGFEHQVTWLDQLPESFQGVMIANEVLDAMPVRVVGHDQNTQLVEKFVALDADNQLQWENHTLPGADAPHNLLCMPPAAGYFSEFHEQSISWIHSLGESLQQGAIILIDYGFPAAEYYHPQRLQGTLMCHLQHRAHADVLGYPGIQDITAHVNFTAIADAALEADLEVLGYTSQANFLMNCGILDLIGSLDTQDVIAYSREVGPVQKLLSEAEMGELFKVMMLGKGLDMNPIGFARSDRRGRL